MMCKKNKHDGLKISVLHCSKQTIINSWTAHLLYTYLYIIINKHTYLMRYARRQSSQGMCSIILRVKFKILRFKDALWTLTTNRRLLRDMRQIAQKQGNCRTHTQTNLLWYTWKHTQMGMFVYNNPILQH